MCVKIQCRFLQQFARQHAKVRDLTYTHACLEVKFGFRQVQKCLKGGSFPVIWTSCSTAVQFTFSNHLLCKTCSLTIERSFDNVSPKPGIKPRRDEKFFLDKVLLLVCTRKNQQVFLDKEPCLKASHDSFQTSKTVCVWSCVQLQPTRKN